MHRGSGFRTQVTAIVVAAAALALAPACLVGADTTAVSHPRPVQLGGQAFGDFVWAVQGRVADSTAFQFRRIYLTADHDLSERMASRLVLEAENGTLAANGRMSAFVKLAYLQFKEFLPAGSLFAGMISTPLWRTTEAVWGYRSVEKTALDFRGFGAASDLGVSVEGTLGRGLPASYSLMVGNGNGQRPENDRSKKAYAAFTIRPGRFVLEPVVDYEGRPGNQDRSTVKLLVGWLAERWALGGEFWHLTDVGGPPDPRGVSVFGRSRIGEKFGAFARYDWFDPDPPRFIPPLPPGVESHNLFVGLDYMPIPTVHVIPNLAVEGYSWKDGRGGPKSDVVARLTLAYQYPR
jgi:hypothetical protein